ncbi:bacterial Ig-like domain family protein [Rhodococcus sp. MTM3W5.2]|uniref:beta strand repeat-containing protein n=1 Tax=Rhodococcus sp. MTM3W5.2 TaxID=1805827 RepID=UPI0009798193|nr:Ig-like domain-containing protein [Rhodococcus sp. MTM3W5.2]AQA26075.1 bacterial Ig-like domain family protein [Rhodococcus sp. MTM3W5.2]
MTVKQNTAPATLSAQYNVGANCTIGGGALQTGMDYSGSLGAGYYGTKGPSLTVAKANSTTTLAPITGAKVGTATTLTATITGGTAGQTVEFYDGTTKIGSTGLNSNGTATFAWTPTTAGNHAISAKFPDTATTNGSQSAPQTVQVTQNVNSTVALAPITNAKVGQASTLTATVNPAAAGGTIEFKDGDTILGTSPVGANGTATLPWTPNAGGGHTIHAAFSGRDGVNASTTTAQVTVAEADVNSTVALAPVTGAKVGTATTLAATVAPAAVGGTIEFKDGDTVLGTSPVGADGTATLPWTPSAGGGHTLHASFSGRDGVNPSTTTGQVTVAEADVNSTVALAPVTGAKVGQATTLTATVAPAGAGGTIEFKDGDTVLGTAPVGADGTATHQWTPAAAGAHTIHAAFSGRDGVNGSTTTGQVTVAEAPVDNTNSTTTLTPVTGAKVGTATTLKATINPAGAGGTVTFKDGTTILGTATVGADGTATYQWTPTTAGAHTINADYSGHGTTNASTTHATVTVAPTGGGNPGTGGGSLGSLFGGLFSGFGS